MTTNQSGTQWETAILTKLTSNGERIAVVEKEVLDVKQLVINTNNNVKSLDERLIKADERLTKSVKSLDERLIKVDERLTKSVKSLDERLIKVDERLTKIEDLLHLLRWITGGVITIALSLIANFIYSIVRGV